MPAAITPQTLTEVITILNHDLRTKFGIDEPHIYVCGINADAGEGGHMGREEIDVIIPTLESLRQKGIHLIGPCPLIHYSSLNIWSTPMPFLRCITIKACRC